MKKRLKGKKHDLCDYWFSGKIGVKVAFEDNQRKI